MTGQDAGRRAAAIAQRIQDEYNAGFVWDEYERTRNRPALKHMIAEAIDAAVAEAVKEREQELSEWQQDYHTLETIGLPSAVAEARREERQALVEIGLLVDAHPGYGQSKIIREIVQKGLGGPWNGMTD